MSRTDTTDGVETAPQTAKTTVAKPAGRLHDLGRVELRASPAAFVMVAAIDDIAAQLESAGAPRRWSMPVWRIFADSPG